MGVRIGMMNIGLNIVSNRLDIGAGICICSEDVEDEDDGDEDDDVLVDPEEKEEDICDLVVSGKKLKRQDSSGHCSCSSSSSM